MPPKRGTSAKTSKAKEEKDSKIEEEEEEKPTTRRSTRNSAKKDQEVTPAKPAKDSKTKAEPAKKSTTKKETKAAGKAAAKAKAAEPESDEELDTSPAKKSPAKKSAPKGKAASAKKDSGSTAKGKGRGKKKQESESEAEESEEDEKPVKKSGKRGRAKSADKAEKDEKEDEGPRKQEKQEKQEWKKPELDSEVMVRKDVRVLIAGGHVYNTYLEGVDSKDPDAKQFHIVQVLDNYLSKFPNHMYTFERWGKIGEIGKWSLRGYFNQKRAIKIYEEKVEEKKKYMRYAKYNAEKKAEKENDEKAKEGEKDEKSGDKTQSQNQDTVMTDTTTQATQNVEQQAQESQKKDEQTNGDSKKAEETKMEEEKLENKEETKGESQSSQPGKPRKLDKDKLDIQVDKYCPIIDKVEVFVKDDEIFDSKYNVSDINKNSNHFYLFQVQRNIYDKTKFYLFSRYGRTGLMGEWVLKGGLTEEEALEAYRDKQKEKAETKKYTQLDLSYIKDDPEILAKAFKQGASRSKLQKQVSDLVQLIFDLKMMNEQMANEGYDSKKLPLGKLSLNMINKGFSILNELSEAIKNNADDEQLKKLSSDFYTIIPQNIGWKNMNTMTIKDMNVIKTKLEFLDSLRQIQVAYELASDTDVSKPDESGEPNPIDDHYKKLNCDITYVEPNSEDYKKVKEFVFDTKEHHNLEIVDMFKINKHGADDNFRKDIHNHVMLWHGSRLTNFVGILSQGLRIAPPEAPVSGYRLGKGIYLADMISKSVPYCYASQSGGTFCIMVCEAVLGTCNEKMHDDFYASNLPTGTHSTKALGHVAPPESGYKEFEPGVKIPGQPEKSKYQGSSFTHNEFIVYNVNQVRIRYLLRMKQNQSKGRYW